MSQMSYILAFSNSESVLITNRSPRILESESAKGTVRITFVLFCCCFYCGKNIYHEIYPFMSING